MKPVLFQVGQVTLRSYTVLLDLGLLLGLAILFFRARRRVARPGRWLDGALGALVIGVLGARIGYVVGHWDYFQLRRPEILRFWLGGLDWHGAAAGVFVWLGMYCGLSRLRFWRLADELALVAPVVAAAAWAGCLLAGCAYGRKVGTEHLLAADMPDLFGVWALRANVPLLGVAVSVAVAVLVWLREGDRRESVTTGLFLLLFGTGMGYIDGLRGDAVLMWGEWRLDVVLDWTIGVIGAVIIATRSSRKRKG